MEYKHLLPFVAVLITFLTINLPVTSATARRRPTPTVPPVADDDGSADYSEDMNNEHFDREEGSGVDMEEGSADDRDPPVYSRMPDFAFGENTHARATTSIYTDIEVEGAGGRDKEENMKVEPLTVFTHPGVLAAIIIGGILTILFIVLLIMFIIYRMRKKDEGSYILDDPKVAMIDHQQQQQQHMSALIYTKSPSNDQEFFA